MKTAAWGLSWPPSASPRQAHNPLLDKTDNSPFLNLGIAPSGGAGLVSTLSDYARFLALLTDGGRWDGAADAC